MLCKCHIRYDCASPFPVLLLGFAHERKFKKYALINDVERLNRTLISVADVIGDYFLSQMRISHTVDEVSNNGIGYYLFMYKGLRE